MSNANTHQLMFACLLVWGLFVVVVFFCRLRSVLSYWLGMRCNGWTNGMENDAATCAHTSFVTMDDDSTHGSAGRPYFSLWTLFLHHKIFKIGPFVNYSSLHPANDKRKPKKKGERYRQPDETRETQKWLFFLLFPFQNLQRQWFPTRFVREGGSWPTPPPLYDRWG